MTNRMRIGLGVAALVLALAGVAGVAVLGVGAVSSALSPAPATDQVAAGSTAAPASPAAVAVPAPPTAPPAAPAPAPAPAAAPAPVVPASPVAGIPCQITTAGDGACVSLSQKKAWLIRGGVADKPVSITTGRKGYRTPTGRFQVEWKDRDHVSKEFDAAPMPYSVFFTDGVAFHTGSLSATSHGCVHLSNSTAKTFFATLQEGDPVQVLG